MSLNYIWGRKVPLASEPATAALPEGTPTPPFCDNAGPTSRVCPDHTATGGGAETERLNILARKYNLFNIRAGSRSNLAKRLINRTKFDIQKFIKLSKE